MIVSYSTEFYNFIQSGINTPMYDICFFVYVASSGILAIIFHFVDIIFINVSGSEIFFITLLTKFRVKGEEERGSWSPDLVIIFFSAAAPPPTHNNNFRPISRDWDIQSRNFKNKTHLRGPYF